MASGFVYFISVKAPSNVIYSALRYTKDTERIANGYRTDNRQYYPDRSQVLPRPKAGTIRNKIELISYDKIRQEVFG